MRSKPIPNKLVKFTPTAKVLARDASKLSLLTKSVMCILLNGIASHIT